MTDLSAPTPLTDTIIPRRPEPNSTFLVYQDESSLEPITLDTGNAWRELERIFPTKNMVVSDKGLIAPTRMEFFWDDRAGLRGVVLFQSDNQIIVHVLHALLGYGGSGPQLSWKIMERLGVSRRMFDDIQASIDQHKPYKVVLKRNGPRQPIPGPWSEWDWWLFQKKDEDQQNAS